MSRYDMQAFRSREGTWERMVEGPGSSVWKPRADLADAVGKCQQWAGGSQSRDNDVGCCPVMQVVDLTTGEVVWRSPPFRCDEDTKAGPAIAADLHTLF